MKFRSKIIFVFLFIVLGGMYASAEQEKLDISDVEDRLWEYYEEVEPGAICGIDVIDNGDEKYMANVFCGVPNNPDNWAQRCYELKIDPVTGEVDPTNTIFGLMMEPFYILPYDGDPASPGVNDQMNNNQTYDLYDLNEDGEKDSICLKTSRGLFDDSVTFYLNGEAVYTFPHKSQWANYSVITLENGEHFIYASTAADSIWGLDRMFMKMEDNTLTEVYNIMDLSESKYWGGAQYLSYEEPIYVDANTIVLKCNCMTWTFGGIVLGYRFEYQEGKLILQPTGNIWKDDGMGHGLAAAPEYVVAQAFDTYLTPSGREKAFTAVPGESISVEMYDQTDGQMSFCLRNTAGEAGWLPGLLYNDVEGYSGSPLFEGIIYAG